MIRTGKLTRLTAGLAAAATVGMAALAPVAAQADGWNHSGGYHQQSRLQNDKNTMRNVAIGSAVLGLLGLANHDNGLAIVGAAGAAVAGSQYEQDRHRQSVDQSWRGQREDGGYRDRGY